MIKKVCCTHKNFKASDLKFKSFKNVDVICMIKKVCCTHKNFKASDLKLKSFKNVDVICMIKKSMLYT